MSPRRANQPVLTRDRIVDAALAVIDGSGLEGLSMRTLGSALGVDAKAVYYHVPSRSALYDLIAERVIGGVPVPEASGGDPLAAVIDAYRGFLAALMQHPRALPLLGSRPLRSAGSLGSVERLLGILYGTGLEPTDALATLDTLGYFVMGLAQAKAAAIAASELLEDSGAERLHELPEADFPNMARLTREGSFPGFDAEFEQGLRRLLAAQGS